MEQLGFVEEPLLTVQEAAGSLRVSVPTLRRMIDMGDVPVVRLSKRIVRIRQDTVESLKR